jgi:putative ABC transport system permease protein
MNSFLQDLHYGLRNLSRNRGFAVVALLTLALGIGANTAIFSVVNAVLLRPLPFPNGNQIVALSEKLPVFTFDIPFNAPDYRAFLERQHSFQSMAIYGAAHFELSGNGSAQRITAARVSASLFPLLGVNPIIGRIFTPAEDQPGHHVAVLSYGLWQRGYGTDPNIVGQSVALDREPYTVIGVMPKNFQFPMRGGQANNEPADLWVPMAFTPVELQGWGNMYNYSVLAKLKPGVTVAQARSDASMVIAQVEKLYPAELVKAVHGAHIGVSVDFYQRQLVGDVRTALLVLLVAVGLVLLIACANVANLLLARASARQKEMAIRAALGAGRMRLVRQLLSESLLVAIAAGLLGILIAFWGMGLLLSLAPADLPRMQAITIDARVLAFAFLLSILTAVIFGLIPGLEASRTDPHEALKEGGRGTTAARSRRGAQSALIVSQTALAVMLLIGAGLLLRSFQRLLETDPGFRPQHVLAMTIPLPREAYSRADQIRNFFREALNKASALPGVSAVGASTDLPLNAEEHDGVEIEGREDNTNLPNVTQSWVMGDYFDTMGITLKRGRLFTPEDRLGSLPVVVISEKAARVYWPGGDPLGKRMKFFENWETVIGIVADVKDSTMAAAPEPHTYTPYLQVPDKELENPSIAELRTLHLAVRTRGNPTAMANSLRAEVNSLDPALAISDVKTGEAAIQESLAPQRFNLSLLGLFAALAIFLSAVGVYGVLSYSVAQRSHEIGVRIALGAQPVRLLAMVIREGLRLTLTGAAIGIAAALFLNRLMADLLYGVTSHDPLTFAGVIALICFVSVTACYVPARRAAKVDPMVALRYE